MSKEKESIDIEKFALFHYFVVFYYNDPFSKKGKSFLQLYSSVIIIFFYCNFKI